ncbi:unnamed protein product [Lactuca virosa]|uniref:Ninja-family protein n=1 Tax=Lactuca virosa TaxID=75947 RepID=A0AAU9PAI2_9ASTR|nr:unnamed protein product [Lactuca virosa]
MANDSRMLETKSVGIVDEDREENELMLELSIGGIFAKSKKTIRNVSESREKDKQEEGDLNVHSKREIQAIRRRELRRKREEKPKKSVGFGSCGSVSGPLLENNEWLEKQILGQNDENFENEPTRKKGRIRNSPENVTSIPAAPITNGFLHPNVMPICGGGEVVPRMEDDLNTKNSVFRATACWSFKPYQGNTNLKPIEDETDGGGRRYSNVNSNGSAGYASSAVSDSQCSSRQGGGTDESRSNSSNSQVDHQPESTSAASEPFDPSGSDQPIGSSKPTGPAVNPNDRFRPPESGVPNPINPTPKLETSSSQNQQQASILARMPCVSTTGNGPNGKTVSGFLYRYTKNEVSIVCVCHGQSFSPAGFVEHAGGVGITHPLKHITILPTAFAS